MWSGFPLSANFLRSIKSEKNTDELYSFLKISLLLSYIVIKSMLVRAHHNYLISDILGFY